MEITCPECGARYEVDAAMVPPGRTVRCARCDATWVPVPEVPDADAPEPAIPETSPPIPPVAEPEPIRAFVPPVPSGEGEKALPRRSPWLLPAWAASVALIALVLWSLLHFRYAVAAAWPPIGRLYGWLGLPLRR